MCPGGSGSQPSSFGGSAFLRPVPITLVECGLDETANDGTHVFEMSVPCPDECSRSVVCGAVSVSSVSASEICDVPETLPADVGADMRRTYPSAVGGFGSLVKRFQKHVNPSSDDVCATLPDSDNLQYVWSNCQMGLFKRIRLIRLQVVSVIISLCLSRVILA